MSVSVNEILNTQFFVTDIWKSEHCDPSNWTKEPSTYGVPGVTLVGSPHMRLWSELDNSWKNPGRAKGTDLGSVSKLVEDILDNGIDTKSPVVYYDIETNERINGGHRWNASHDLNIPGWMMQGVSFANKIAKIEFATASNNDRVPVASRPSREDVMSAMREIIAEDNSLVLDTNKKELKEKVARMCKGVLSDSVRTQIIVMLRTEVALSSKTNSSPIRFLQVNEGVLGQWMEESLDKGSDAFKDYWDNPEEETLYVNTAYWKDRIGTIVTQAASACQKRQPLHLFFSVDSKNLFNSNSNTSDSLTTKRQKVFSNMLHKLEDNLCNTLGMDPDRHRNNLPWNHPDARHFFVPQDMHKENQNYFVDARPFQ